MKKLLKISFLLIGIIFTIDCELPQNNVYVPIGNSAKVNSDGTIFGMNSGDVPFADSASALHLYTSASGSKDTDGTKKMISSGRVIFLPVGSFVDVLEHDKKEIATKVRIRSGENIGREMWTHPKFISAIKEQP